MITVKKWCRNILGSKSIKKWILAVKHNSAYKFENNLHCYGPSIEETTKQDNAKEQSSKNARR